MNFLFSVLPAFVLNIKCVHLLSSLQHLKLSYCLVLESCSLIFFLSRFISHTHHFQPVDEYAVPGSGVSSALQHHALANAHLHYAPVPQAAPLLPPLDVRAAWQDVHHHQNLGGQCFFFSFSTSQCDITTFHCPSGFRSCKISGVPLSYQVNMIFLCIRIKHFYLQLCFESMRPSLFSIKIECLFILHGIFIL